MIINLPALPLKSFLQPCRAFVPSANNNNIVRRRFFVSVAASTKNESSSSHNYNDVEPECRVGIIGGGIAGLSTAFHLTQKYALADITILDKAPIATNGASIVAGGLLHPLSPKGKIAHLGLEALECTNELVDHALQFEPDCVLRNELYRVALTQSHVNTLQQIGNKYRHFCEYLDNYEVKDLVQAEVKSFRFPYTAFGALRLFGGCKVLHVPTYLKGLWSAIQNKATITPKWKIVPPPNNDDNDDNNDAKVNWKEILSDFDIVVFAAGSGLFQDQILSDSYNFPIQLVRGQSLEVKLDNNDDNSPWPTLLCGKYVAPLPDRSKLIIGATHEYQPEPWDQEKIVQELKTSSHEFTSQFWDMTSIDRVTSGIRVQSQRGKYGRLPIIGQYETPDHPNAWIFTGLSGRGILYHGLYGDMLTDLIVADYPPQSPSPEATYNNVQKQRRKRNSYSQIYWWRK